MQLKNLIITNEENQILQCRSTLNQIQFPVRNNYMYKFGINYV